MKRLLEILVLARMTKDEVLASLLLATCIGLPFVLYFAFVMKP